MRKISVSIRTGIGMAAAAWLVTACGGGSNGNYSPLLPTVAGEAPSNSPPGAGLPDPNPQGGGSGAAYGIGGRVAGLLSPVTLQINGTQTLSVSADGTFDFPTALPIGASYSVTVSAQPLWQQCSISNGSGSVSPAVHPVQVTCAAPRARASKLAGADDQASGASDGRGSAARFNEPSGLAFNAVGNLYVSDRGNGAIRELKLDGTTSTIALSGEAVGGQGHLAVSPTGEMFVAGHESKRVYKIFGPGPDFGRVIGLGPFVRATGAAIDAAGNLFVADADAGVITKHAALGGVKQLALDAPIGKPYGLSIDGAGTLYLTDQGSHRILKIENESKVTVLAGGTQGNVDGVGSAARFNYPRGIAVGAAGLVYVSDTNSIRVVAPNGAVATLAGTGAMAGATDGVGFAASFSEPDGIAVGPNNVLYVADSFNNSIRKLERP